MVKINKIQIQQIKDNKINVPTVLVAVTIPTVVTIVIVAVTIPTVLFLHKLINHREIKINQVYRMVQIISLRYRIHRINNKIMVLHYKTIQTNLLFKTVVDRINQIMVHHYKTIPTNLLFKTAVDRVNKIMVHHYKTIPTNLLFKTAVDRVNKIMVHHYKTIQITNQPYKTVQINHPYKMVQINHPYKMVQINHPYKMVQINHQANNKIIIVLIRLDSKLLKANLKQQFNTHI